MVSQTRRAARSGSQSPARSSGVKVKKTGKNTVAKKRTTTGATSKQKSAPPPPSTPQPFQYGLTLEEERLVQALANKKKKSHQQAKNAADQGKYI